MNLAPATVSTLNGQTYTHDADDRLGSDQYDPNGNTINSLAVANTYDFENHLVQHGTQPGAVTIVYDGDGNRVSETVAGVTTKYLVDTQNPTGYAQVVDELQNAAVTKTYSYGLERISQNWQPTTGNWQSAFYGYDGHGSVRFLTDASENVTDTYDYDAFGNLINSTGTTPNNYLFASEQYDPALGLYYNRARYLDTGTGRFWSADSRMPKIRTPFTLHLYGYASANPVNRIDRSGHEDIAEVEESMAIEEVESMQGEVLRAGERTEDLASQAGQDIETDIETSERELNWKEAENATQDEIGADESQIQVQTSQGPRKLDAYSSETDTAAESKSGQVTLRESIQKQIDKDSELLRSGGTQDYPIKSIEWHFWRSPYTGLVGPDADVL